MLRGQKKKEGLEVDDGATQVGRQCESEGRKVD